MAIEWTPTLKWLTKHIQTMDKKIGEYAKTL